MNDKELYHHGILGQKWGKRNGPPYPLENKNHSISKKKVNRSINKDSIKKALIIGATVSVMIGAGIVLTSGNGISNIKLGQRAFGKMKKVLDTTDMGDIDIILPKGLELHRMEAFKNVDYSNATDPIYTSFWSNDIDIYRYKLKDWVGTGKRYDNTLKAINELTSPSQQKRAKIFNNLWNNNKEYRTAVMKEYLDFVNNQFSSNHTMKEVKDYFKQLSPQEVYERAIWSIVRKQKAGNIYISEVIKNGYNALFDDMDIINNMSQTPLIVLNPKNDVVKVGEKFINMNDIYKYWQYITDVSNMPILDIPNFVNHSH